MKKLLSAVALAACAVFGANATTTIAWPSWAIGTWAGNVVNYVPDKGETYDGFYKLTLSATSVQEEYVFDDGEIVKRADAWNDVKITDQDDCHLVMTCWYWSDSRTQKFDATMVFCKEGCGHHATSSYSSKIAGGDTVDVKELTKLEMNTAPAEGWPEWVIGTWSGDLSCYVPDKRETFTGTYTLTVNATGANAKCVFDDGDDGFNEDLRGWDITDRADCHVVGTCWRWNDEKDDWLDANFVFRDTDCSHYAQSSCSAIMHLGDSAGKDTIEVANLKKFELAASYGPFVPGEEVVDVVIPALVGYAAKGLPSGLKFNTKTGAVMGAAKKPTGDDGAKVTFTKKGAESVTTRFIVGPVPMVSVTLAGGTNKCSVAGAGKAYLAGKKVTLTAKAPKGTAFLGWTKGGEPWPDEETAEGAKLTFEMPAEDVALVATFKEEVVSLACPTLAEGSFTVGVSGDAAEGLPIEVAADSDVKSVKAAKLPSGMKLVKDKATGAWSIVGTPTKAGTYEVVLTVTTAAGSTRQFPFTVTVVPLPAWAVGTFGGMVGFSAVPDGEGDDEVGGEEEEDFFPCGSISLKVAATGRLTAKVVAGGKTYSFSANGFSGYDAKRETYWFEMETKAGDVYAGEISKSWHDVETMMRGGEDEEDEPEGGFLPAGWEEPFDAYLWRNEHGRDGRLGTDVTGRARKAMDAVKALKRVELAQFDPAWGTVAVTIGANGVTKISGTTEKGVRVSRTSFLMLDDDDCHIISDLNFYDKKTGRVYGGAVCWQPIFDDETGEVVGWDDECCNKKLRVYPFAPAD